MSLSTALLAVPAVPLQLTVDPIWAAVIAVGIVLAAALVGPLVVLSLRDHREPTAAERDRFAELTVGVDYEPDRVRIVEPEDDSITVSIRGPPSRRTLLLSVTVLTELDVPTAGALLAAERARSRLFYIEYRAVAAALIIGIATAMFGGLIEFSDGIGLLAFVALVLFWIGRQLQFRADQVAANRVGGETLATAFETVAAHSGVEPEPATWKAWFEVQPPLGQRIARLRSRS